MYEIKQIAELLLDRRVYVTYEPDPLHSAHNTYAGMKHPGWRPTDLSTGMRLVKLRLLNFLSRGASRAL